MEKAPEAFRTISEVAEALQTPAHVLRFWESKFTQVRPVKRAGGRRYYRPADMDLLFGIRSLLHDQGMTIRGVQKMLQENGTAHVAAIGRDTQHDNAIEGEATALPTAGADHSHHMGDDSPAPAESSWVEEDPDSDPVGGPDNIIDIRPAGGAARHGARTAATARSTVSETAEPAGQHDDAAATRNAPDAAKERAGSRATGTPPAPAPARQTAADTPDDASLMRDSAHAIAIRLRQMKREDLAPVHPGLRHVADRLDRHLNLLARRSGAGRG